MALSSSNLLEWITHSQYLLKNYTSKLISKYKYGIDCEDQEKKLLLASFYLEEVELYYDNCSCLTEAIICKFIVEIQKLLS